MEQQLTLDQIQDFKGKYPRQIWSLFFSEMWERFCFYAMRGMLTYFMVYHLFMDEKTAQLQYGATQAFVYAFTFIGGMFADKLLGFRRSLFWGGLLMITGSVLLAINPHDFFFVGIAFNIVGTGFFKPNISSMVGQLYKAGDSRTDAGFLLFYSGINLGAFFGGFVISIGKGTLFNSFIPENLRWNVSFGLAALVMLISLVNFIFTKRKLATIGLSPLDETKTTNKIKQYAVYVGTLIVIPLIMTMVSKTEYTDYFMYFIGPASIAFLFYELVHTTSNKKYISGEKTFVGLMILLTLVIYWVMGGSLGNPQLNFNALMLDHDLVVGIRIGFVSLFFILFYVGVFIFCEKSSRKILAAMSFILFSVIFWAIFEQAGGSLSLFAAEHLQDKLLGVSMDPNAVNNSINSLFVIGFAPIVGLFFIALSKRKLEPNSVVKFGLGFLLLGLGFYIFYLLRFSANDSGKSSLNIFSIAYLVVSFAELFLSPIGLSLMTKLSPYRLQGFMMGMWFLASAYGQYVAGLFGASISPDKNNNAIQKLAIYTQGYKDFALYALVAGVVLIIISPMVKKLMQEVK